MAAFRKFLSRFTVSGVIVIQYACIAHCMLEHGVNIVACSGPSMLPVIKPKDIVLAEYYSVNYKKIKRGDVVICRSTSNPTQFICKRVIGLEGDLMEQPPQDSLHHTSRMVPTGHVWLEGDNSMNSTDSRSYGAVPYALLRSKVFVKIWPLWNAGWIGNSVKTAS